jgi:exopolyphosphatase/guanosine-5'-triphosphate,3'-diphosphate pyrophosphatase
VATSALRTAPNRDSAIQRLLGATGIEVRVLSEQEEAEYAARGVIQALGMQSGLIFDLGGGGLHIARLKAGQVVATHGYLLGTLRLLRRFPNFAPTSPGELEAMRAFVAGKFSDNAWLRDGMSGGAKLVGIGGTVRALARIEQASKGISESLRGYAISAEAIENWVRTLSAMTVDDLLALPGLKSARIDMVLFGAIIVRELMSAAGAKVLHVCDTSIRDGIASEFVSRMAANGSR